MKIAFFDDRYHMVYGAQENVLLLAEWTAEAGHDVMVVTTGEGPFAQSARERGLEASVVRAPERLLQFDRSPFYGGLLAKLGASLAALRYNLRLARALRVDGASVVVASTSRAALWVVIAGLLRRPRMILWVQGDERRRLMALMVGLSAWRIALIGPSCSNLFAPWLRRRFEYKFRPLPSARNLTEFADRSLRPQPDAGSPLRLVSVGSITHRKGFDVLLDALADLDTRDLSLTIVGGTTNEASDQYLARLQALARRYRLDVEFVGWQDDVTPFLDDADVFVLASRSEGLPGVLLEAMASGLPCITTTAGDSGTMVEECKAGLVVGVGDTEGLSRAIDRLAADPVARRRFGENGRRLVARRYSPQVCHEAFEAIAGELARSKP